PAPTRLLARIDDQALLHYAGFLAKRPRCAVALAALLTDYFGVPAKVQQFRGKWHRLDAEQTTRLGGGPAGRFNRLGSTFTAGDRVWDVQGQVLIRLGPLDYEQFLSFLPDDGPTPERKAYYLLVHLVRLYLGPDLEFDVQPVLRAEDVPPMKLGGPDGVRLGWTSWPASTPAAQDADGVVLAGREATVL
ncbi:MAG: type VI secretion system baseplate subunit TssG, partial [Planctomycetia bacterium]